MSAFLQNWCIKALDSGIVQMMSLAKTLSGHALGILNYFHFPISSGKIEGINNKVGCLKRAAYGYRDGGVFHPQTLLPPRIFPPPLRRLAQELPG
jgi:transposase